VVKFKLIGYFLFPVLAILVLSPLGSAGLALFLGVIASFIFGNPYQEKTKKLTHPLLSTAIVGLGAGTNLSVIAKAGIQGIFYTIAGILTAFTIGKILTKILKTNNNTSILITVGTAICGGSAIAAVAPVIKAKTDEISIALGIVFILNAVALFIFPVIGHSVHLTENQFGLWSALAIHDTSSVLGATMQYGSVAVAVGTTLKLARALWIIPVTAIIGFIRSNNLKEDNITSKPKKPWFILGFLITAALVSLYPNLQPFGHQVEFLSKKLMVLTLFLIGANLTIETIKSVGVKPLLQGIILWGLISGLSLGAILYGVIS
jgi:uncharacterized integral membrane protein (TIGR00698 family)